jgi:hypothetical protein
MWAREDSASSIVVGCSRSLKTLNRKPETASAPKYRPHKRRRTSAMQLIAQDNVVAHLYLDSVSCLSDLARDPPALTHATTAPFTL